MRSNGTSREASAHDESPNSYPRSRWRCPCVAGSEPCMTNSKTLPESRKVPGINLESMWVVNAVGAVVLSAITVLCRKQC